MLQILIPLDGSELAERALPHACAIAGSVAAKITLLRVVTPAEFRSEDAFSRVDWRLRKHQAQTYLQDAAERFAWTGIDFELAIQEGSPAETILEKARLISAQLLVMSTHGDGAAVGFPQGGVAGKVLSTFDASVLLVGAASAAGEDVVKTGYRHIAVPIDGSHEAECALRVATVLSKSEGCRLSIIYISEAPTLPPIARNDERARSLCSELGEIFRRAAERKLTALQAQLSEVRNLKTSVMLSETPGSLLTDIASKFAPDLLVTSSGTVSNDARLASYAPIMPVANNTPVLVLNPKSIGGAFCETRPSELPAARTADVS